MLASPGRLALRQVAVRNGEGLAGHLGGGARGPVAQTKVSFFGVLCFAKSAKLGNLAMALTCRFFPTFCSYEMKYTF